MQAISLKLPESVLQASTEAAQSLGELSRDPRFMAEFDVHSQFFELALEEQDDLFKDVPGWCAHYQIHLPTDPLSLFKESDIMAAFGRDTGRFAARGSSTDDDHFSYLRCRV